MNFTCDHCQHRYSIADDKVRGKTVKVRCRHCNHLISVEGPPEQKEERTTMMSLEQVERLRAEGAGASPAPSPASTPWDDEATRAAPPPSNRPEWFAMVKGKQAGPFDPRGIAELVRSGDVTEKSYLWRQGMAEWKRGADLPELALVFAGGTPPPPPVAEPPVDSGGPPAGSGAGTGVNLDELFSDADLPEKQAGGIEDEPTVAPVGKASARRKKDEPEPDPFAQLGSLDEGELPPPGEATRFFIAQAGVNKRNPPWKIALFVVGGVAIPVGILFLLSTFNVVPLKVKTVDASGKVVEQSVFSASGVSHLGDMLLGKGKKPIAEPPMRVAANAPRPQAEKAPPSGANMPKVDVPQTHLPTADELAALYGDTSHKDLGPKIRKDMEVKAKDTSTGGLPPEQIAKVVQQSQSAFQSCIEQELRKNPNLRVPRFYINATVANSGVVTAAVIDQKAVDGSPLGECLKARARRMVFAQFSGDEVEVQIPLIVGVSM